MKYKTISQSEIDDFEKSIINNGYSVEDFSPLAETDLTNYDSPDDNFVDKGEVAITRKSTGKARIYQTGYASKWPAEFEEDLTKSTFN